GRKQLFDELFLGLAGVTVNIVHRHVRRRVPEHTLDHARMHPTIGQPGGQSVAHRMKSEPSHWLSVVVANTIPQLKNISGDRGRMNVVSHHDTSRAPLQNVVERAVVLSETDTFFVDESWLKLESTQSGQPVEELSTLSDREVEIIEAN